MSLPVSNLGGQIDLNGKAVQWNANKGALTMAYSKENGYAIVSKIEGQENDNVQFNSPNGIIDYSVISELKAKLAEEFETIQAVFNV